MNVSGDPKASTTIVIGVIGAILLLAIIVFTQVLFYNAQRYEDEQKIYASKPQELLKLQTEQLAEINRFRKLDEQKGVVAIPIDLAIECFVAEMKNPRPPATMNVPASGPAQPQVPSHTP